MLTSCGGLHNDFLSSYHLRNFTQTCSKSIQSGRVYFPFQTTVICVLLCALLIFGVVAVEPLCLSRVSLYLFKWGRQIQSCTKTQIVLQAKVSGFLLLFLLSCRSNAEGFSNAEVVHFRFQLRRWERVAGSSQCRPHSRCVFLSVGQEITKCWVLTCAAHATSISTKTEGSRWVFNPKHLPFTARFENSLWSLYVNCCTAQNWLLTSRPVFLSLLINKKHLKALLCWLVYFKWIQDFFFKFVLGQKCSWCEHPLFDVH